MTDRTHPDSGRTTGGIVEMLQDRVAEVEAQLEAIGAGGVTGPLVGQPQAMPDLSALTERGAKAWAGVDAQALRAGGADMSKEREALVAYLKDCDGKAIVPDVAGAWHAAFQAGRASLAASAGSEPVAWVDERVISWLANSRANSATIGTTLEKGKSSERPMPLYTHPSPPEGMAMVPKVPTEEMVDAFENAMESASMYVRNFQAAYRAMIAAATPSPTTSAGSGEGE